MQKITQKIVQLWKENSANKNIYMLCLATVLGIVGAYVLLLQPIRSAREAQEREIHAFKEQVERLRSYDMSEQEFLEINKELTTRRENAMQILPSAEDSFVTVAIITDMAKSNNLSIRNFKVADKSEKDGYKVQRFDCIVSGGYFELVAFLEQLQKRRPLTNVQISSINAESDNMLVATMQIYTYTLT